MSLIMRLEGAQADAADSAGAATTLSGARGVYCYQSGASARLITVQDNSSGSDVVVGTITIPAGAGAQLRVQILSLHLFQSQLYQHHTIKL